MSAAMVKYCPSNLNGQGPRTELLSHDTPLLLRGEYVLVLSSTRHQSWLLAICHDEFQTREARDDRNERDCAIRIVTRGNLTLELTEIEDGRKPAPEHGNVTKRGSYLRSPRMLVTPRRSRFLMRA